MHDYAEVRVLGEGSFGKALLCRRKQDRKLVVVKQIRVSSLSDSEKADAIREASVLASLDHPFIVKYYDSFEENGMFFIVMEYCDGGDLAKMIQTSALLSEAEVLHIFVQIVLAIKYIHDKKILHRDLKCQNIFLTKDGTVKLGDFGIARVLEHTFQLCHTQVGTPYYLSPEICEGKNYNSKTDIWSLGCILYELCTLRHAFSAQNMNALFVNIIRGRYDPIPKRFSNELQLLVSRMLTYDSRMRPSINGILATPMIKSYIRTSFQKMTDVKPKPNVIRSSLSEDGIRMNCKKRQERMVDIKRKELIIQEEMQRAKRLQEIVKRRKEGDDLRKKQEAAKRRREQELRVKEMERLMNVKLDTAGQIRYNEYLENRERAEENRRKGQAWHIMSPSEALEIPKPDIQVPVETTKIVNPTHQVPVETTKLFNPCHQVPVETTTICELPHQMPFETTKVLSPCHQVPVETTRIWSGLYSEEVIADDTFVQDMKHEKEPDWVSSPPMSQSPVPTDTTIIDDKTEDIPFHDSLPISPPMLPKKVQVSPRLVQPLSPKQTSSCLKKTISGDASPPRSSIRKAVSIDSVFLDESISLASEERRRQMQKQREALEASRKLFMDMNLETRRQIEDLSPLVPTQSSLRQRSLSQSLGRVSSKPAMVSPRIPDMDNLIECEIDDTEDAFEAAPQPSFFLRDRTINFPTVKDTDSPTYRAEAIRAFLEKELGLDRLMEFMHDLELQNSGLSALSRICQELDPGIVILMQQLIILDQLPR